MLLYEFADSMNLRTINMKGFWVRAEYMFLEQYDAALLTKA